MRRRAHLKALIAGVFTLKVGESQTAAKGNPPIHLFVEMEVDGKNEREMLFNFHEIFVPEAKKHPGFISVKMLKFRKVMMGTAPPVNYRFELEFESEELRQKWISSAAHQRVWPTVEKFIKTPASYPVVLFDEV